MKNLGSLLIKDLIEYFDGDAARINHALKVYSFAKAIADLENLEDEKREVVVAASILHDIGIKKSEEKYNSSAGNYQEIEGPPEARGILNKYEIKDEFIERVCFIIGHHHSYAKIDGIDFQVLVEADFLVNIYEDEISKGLIPNIKNNYFKTNTGICFLENIYQ